MLAGRHGSHERAEAVSNVVPLNVTICPRGDPLWVVGSGKKLVHTLGYLKRDEFIGRKKAGRRIGGNLVLQRVIGLFGHVERRKAVVGVVWRKLNIVGVVVIDDGTLTPGTGIGVGGEHGILQSVERIQSGGIIAQGDANRIRIRKRTGRVKLRYPGRESDLGICI